MKKLNKTYVMGIVGILFSAWLFLEIQKIPEHLVSNEPGPKLFPYIATIGILCSCILSMIFDGPKDKKEDFLSKEGWKNLFLLLAEVILFAIAMYYIGFWITAVAGMLIFVYTLKGEKKINFIFTLVLCIGLGTLCYFSFTRGFKIQLPKGEIWTILGIAVP